jgi:hypothetical protein
VYGIVARSYSFQTTTDSNIETYISKFSTMYMNYPEDNVNCAMISRQKTFTGTTSYTYPYTGTAPFVFTFTVP